MPGFREPLLYLLMPSKHENTDAGNFECAGKAVNKKWVKFVMGVYVWETTPRVLDLL